MIDHVSIPVKNLRDAAAFYEPVLKKIGYDKLIEKDGTVGFGKKYPDFWLNERTELDNYQISDGFHVCLRVPTIEAINEFHKKALELGAQDSGEPGYRKEYATNYYAAFVVDIDGNRIEVVTFA